MTPFHRLGHGRGASSSRSPASRHAGPEAATCAPATTMARPFPTYIFKILTSKVVTITLSHFTDKL